MKLSSFISEHTGEYALIPDLRRRLSPRYRNIVPIYFWSSREGNVRMLEKLRPMPVRLLTAFARRPKVDKRHPGTIYLKVNKELVEYAHASEPLGLPVIAGIPLVSSVFDLAGKPR